jgi:GT2 family glycosyltransferase
MAIGRECGVVSPSHHDGESFAKACNDGAAAAGPVDYLVFLSEDAVPVEGWLEALVDEAEAHPEAAAIGAKLLDADGIAKHAGIVIGCDRRPHHIYAGFPGDHPAVNRPKEVAAVSAACMLVRRECFERVGGFDGTGLGGYEDVDLCLRLREAGHRIRYCPRSALLHSGQATRWVEDRGSGAGDERDPLGERWGERLVPDDLGHYVADGLISIEYGSAYPVEISVAPELASVAGVADDGRLARLLSLRSRQVEELQAERTEELLGRPRPQPAPPAAAPRRDRAERLHDGTVRRLGPGPPARLVSVLMPLKDSAAELREALPRLFEQRAGVELEVIAVDSGSSDDTVAVLEEHGATVLAIDPADFDHGLTRNLAAEHARGSVLVFLNARARPVDDGWLAPLLAALDGDPSVAGACSRVLARPDADLLTKRDVSLDPSGSPQRFFKTIGDWSAYRALPVAERRLLLNFHTVSAAIRAEVLERIPFRSVRTLGEDLLWASEVLESGLALVHEPDSRVYHSHDYSLRELFMRNVDDGVANHDINGRTLSEAEAGAQVRAMVAGDWEYLRGTLGTEGEELEDWQIAAAMRRVAQAAGQWLGANHGAYPPEVSTAFSRTAAARRTGT